MEIYFRELSEEPSAYLKSDHAKICRKSKSYGAGQIKNVLKSR